MTALEAYKTFLEKINKQDSNTNIKVNKGRFVLIFNEQARFWVKQKIQKDGVNSSKNHFQELLVVDEELTKVNDLERFAVFTLPPNLLEFENSFSIASRGNCNERVLFNWDFKGKNRNVVLQDENNNPDFDYEQTVINLSDNKLLVYKTDFTIDKQFISYYREPNLIDLAGYTRIDGTPSTNIDPEFSNDSIDEIINRCAIEVLSNYQNVEGFQLAKDKLSQE